MRFAHSDNMYGDYAYDSLFRWQIPSCSRLWLWYNDDDKEKEGEDPYASSFSEEDYYNYDHTNNVIIDM